MTFKIIASKLDFRTDLVVSQAATIDTFFQNNTIIRWWASSSNEYIIAEYEDVVPVSPTRFTIFDFGKSIEANITEFNANTTIQNFIASNTLVKDPVTVEDSILLIEYKAR